MGFKEGVIAGIAAAYLAGAIVGMLALAVICIPFLILIGWVRILILVPVHYLLGVANICLEMIENFRKSK